VLVLLVVGVEAAANNALGFGHNRIAIEVDFLLLGLPPQRCCPDIGPCRHTERDFMPLKA
jgi:hypothetical protein